MQKLKASTREPTPDEVRFARKISSRAHRGATFVVGCFGLVVVYWLFGAALAALVAIFGLFFEVDWIIGVSAIPVGLALLLLLAYAVSVAARGSTPTTAQLYEVRSRGFVSFEPADDEGAHYAFDLGDEKIVFVGGKEFDKAKNFPCLDFALVNLRDGRTIIASRIECRSPKDKPVRTIPAQISRTLAMPANFEVRSGKLETIEQVLKRPEDEIVETYSYERGLGMLRKADQEQWKRRLIRRKMNGRAAFIWSRLAKPNVRLKNKGGVLEDDTAPLTSKLGGLPDLPKGMAWPTYQSVPWEPPPRAPGFFGRLLGRKPEPSPPPPAPQATPVPFLGQINLADIAKVGCDLPLPETGLLLFFYESHEDGYAASETTGARVLYVAEGTETERPSAPPVKSAPACVLECEPGETLPDVQYVEEYVPAYESANFDEVYESSDEESEQDNYAGSAFGGWSSPIQGTMELECELYANGIRATPDGYTEAKERGLDKKAKEWRLLLQLTSDDTPELEWGDTGMVYVLCRKKDIAERRFERCCFIHQFY